MMERDRPEVKLEVRCSEAVDECGNIVRADIRALKLSKDSDF